MKCPSCKGTLDEIEYEGIAIETCAGCGGEWLDADELAEIVKAREVRFSPEERRAIAAAAKVKGIVVADQDRGLMCPSCDQKLSPLHYGGDSGIVIERCPGCGGLWLDRDEIEKIQLFVEQWDDQLPDDLAEHRARLHAVEARIDQQSRVKVSRLNFVNVIMNGILDLLP